MILVSCGLNQLSQQKPGMETGLYQQEHGQFELKGHREQNEGRASTQQTTELVSCECELSFKKIIVLNISISKQG